MSMFNLWGLNQDRDRSSWAKDKGEEAQKKQSMKNAILKIELIFIVEGIDAQTSLRIKHGYQEYLVKLVVGSN